MIEMQYKIILPRNYDMDIIRKRVQDNGHKTDGFPGLLFKAYLITEANKNGNAYNSYAPLYVWNDTQGMNQFIFEGFYDNILDSFGWQHIQIGIPLSIHLAKDFKKSRYVLENSGDIPESPSLVGAPIKLLENAEESLGRLCLYNPDKWRFSEFYFYEEKPAVAITGHPMYEILHISH
ncbi:DUF4865 family protein [Heyndrickxia acidicola]|uniref:DUF4865 family protein n=1 Tax=Heyndrickxia acidicola TaxID=209389 RepID=A0ABU6MF20_9BACI|nr:DUF4865 family protein [Heyndrickxia acidicola]MED1203277.1 DUF4865 family protein [Heyndrickxia acidicola]